jgi:hypothetical protein
MFAGFGPLAAGAGMIFGGFAGYLIERRAQEASPEPQS